MRSKASNEGCRCLTLVPSHHDVRGGLEVLSDEIAEGVVLLQHDEVGRVAHAFREEIVSNKQTTVEESSIYQ